MMSSAPSWVAKQREPTARMGRTERSAICSCRTGSLRSQRMHCDLHSGAPGRSWSITGMAPGLSAGRNFLTGPPSIRPSESNELCSGALCEVALPMPARSKAGDSCARRLIGLTDEPLTLTQAHLVCQQPADPN
jgi:hypothetical protein